MTQTRRYCPLCGGKATVAARTLARIETIVQDACAQAGQQHDVDASEIRGRSKYREVMAARRTAYRILADRGWSVSRIGRAFGRDHSTISHGLKGQP